MLSVNSSNLLLTAPMSYINAGSSSDIGAYCYGNNMYWGLDGKTTLMNLKNNALKLSLGNLSGGLEVEGSAAGYTAATLKLISLGSANIRGTGIVFADIAGGNQWYIGRPYNSSDKIIFARKSDATLNDEVAQTGYSTFAITPTTVEFKVQNGYYDAISTIGGSSAAPGIAGYRFKSSNGDYTIGSVEGVSQAENFGYGRIDIKAASNITTGAMATAISIRGAEGGQVGILNTSPTEALDISGNLRFSGALMPNGTAGTAGYVLTSTGAGSAPNYISPANIVSNGGGLTTSTTFSGDVTGLYNNTQIAANAVTSAEIANGTITGFDIAAATITSTNLNTTGVTSGTYGSATQAPVITVGTDGRIISASNTTISGTNIYTADGSLTGNRTVTIGANSLTMKNTTTGANHKLLILSDYMGSNDPKLLSFSDENNIERGYLSNNTTTGVNIYGQYGIDIQSGGNMFFRPNGKTFGFYGTGYMTFENIASDPGSTGDGALWYNYVAGRMKYTANSTTHSIASLETDIIGDAPAANSSSFTLPAQQFYTVADANGGSFTITFDGTMREGIDYVIECRRNGTNTITFDAGSGYNLAVDTVSTFPDDGAVAMGGGGSGIQAAHKVYYVRRHGSSVSVK
jgi:hypothetical protein